MYIRATGNISAQRTFGHPSFLSEVIETKGNRLHCIEPDYKEIIDGKWIRRMSRIIKIGVTAALECLQEANLKNPGAIITGSAYGCMEDTGVFMKKLVENNEELLTPTSFIQSTHNTVGAQIALILSCNQYNNTFVHRGFSFEAALLDAMMLLQENETDNILVGAVDEITDYSHAILSRFGLYKNKLQSNLHLYNLNSKGTIAGEGASFFLLAKESSDNDYAKLDGMTTFYKPSNPDEIKANIRSFLEFQNTKLEDIDVVISGCNGDNQGDRIYENLNATLFRNSKQINYKHLCGEYPTATSFALWAAANILKTNTVPAAFGRETKQGDIRKVLIYNNYLQLHHSLFLISVC